MTARVREEPREITVTEFARRWQLIAGTIAATGIIVTAAGQLLTRDVRAEVRDLRMEMVRRAAADSVRFERTIEVVELAVVAVVEEEGSPARAEAIEELKRRRRVAPH